MDSATNERHLLGAYPADIIGIDLGSDALGVAHIRMSGMIPDFDTLAVGMLPRRVLKKVDGRREYLYTPEYQESLNILLLGCKAGRMVIYIEDVYLGRFVNSFAELLRVKAELQFIFGTAGLQDCLKFVPPSTWQRALLSKKRKTRLELEALSALEANNYIQWLNHLPCVEQGYAGTVAGLLGVPHVHDAINIARYGAMQYEQH